jgi:thiamine phosphate synthase YjbQ (UPF0047 family)
MMQQSRSITRAALTRIPAGAVVSTTFTVETTGEGFVDLTREIKQFIHDGGAAEGLETLFTRHTSASLTIQENADSVGAR